MAGTALAAGILTVAASLSLGLAAVGGGGGPPPRPARGAAAAALAAADATSGAIVTGEEPCALAARVAAAAGGRLSACTLDDFAATVEVRSAYAGLVAASRARAGQPGG